MREEKCTYPLKEMSSICTHWFSYFLLFFCCLLISQLHKCFWNDTKWFNLYVLFLQFFPILFSVVYLFLRNFFIQSEWIYFWSSRWFVSKTRKMKIQHRRKIKDKPAQQKSAVRQVQPNNTKYKRRKGYTEREAGPAQHRKK